MQSNTLHNKRRYLKEVEKFYDLYRIIENAIPREVLEKKNQEKSWQYGYNEEYDVIIISKDGTIGQIWEIQELLIALPKAPEISEIEGNDLYKSKQCWIRKDMPNELKKFKTMYGEAGYLKAAPTELIERFDPYIKEEFRRRFEGHWFMNNGVPTYIVGQHYVYLQWSPIDVGYAEFWIASMISYYHWEACKADRRCYGQVKVKCRRSGASHEASSDLVETATITKRALNGIVSKTGDDAESFFTDKTVMKYRDYPFFFKPLQDGTTNPKKELAYRAPAERITAKNKGAFSEDDGLESRINWKSTANNSYDSEKIKLIIEDEAGKWLPKLGDILVHWRRVKPTLRTGKKVVGKCKMITTVNPKDEGGESFKKLWLESDVRNRMPNGETRSGLYQLFVRAEYNFEGFIDKYGFPVLEDPESPIESVSGEEMIENGAFRYFDNVVEALRDDPDGLNDFLRENPRQIEHAFREPSKKSPFTLAKIYEHIDHNEEMVQASKGGGVIQRMETEYTRYKLVWKDGKPDTTVDPIIDSEGRFYCSWLPPTELRNNYKEVDGLKVPLNTDLGGFGCDPYDISQTVRVDKQSNGAFTGVSKGKHMGGPEYGMFLEYCDRPNDVNDFFEDVIMACVFWGMKVLPERDKARLLYQMKSRGYRKYVANRPDKDEKELTGPDKEIGGYPGKNEILANDQVTLIENYVIHHLGASKTDTYREAGTFSSNPFNRTLHSLTSFDPANRTKSDLVISLGAAFLNIQPKGFYGKKEKAATTTVNIGLTPINN